MKMPKAGYKTITVNLSVYSKIDAQARKHNRSISREVKLLVEKAEKAQRRTEKKEPNLNQTVC
jgi:macrodomain Ter protein organizer (MatP/YcbG family)